MDNTKQEKEARLVRALAEVKTLVEDDTPFSVNQVALKHLVPKSTLHEHVNGMRSRIGSGRGPTLDEVPEKGRR
jgi:hypothetical protein